jgi:hypothetical protein
VSDGGLENTYERSHAGRTLYDLDEIWVAAEQVKPSCTVPE